MLVLRPEPGAAATLEAARAAGLAAEAHPLFAVRALAWEPVAAGEVDGLLLGSANAVRHAGPALDAARALPAHVVGQATAEAARGAGLTVETVGTGGLQGVLDALAPRAPMRLLRLAGRERIELAVPPGITVVTREVYASEPLPLPPALAQRLAAPSLVLLHSGEAAARLAQLCDEAAIDRAAIALAAIGPRVAVRAGAGWRRVESAPRPDDAGLLALALRMCQTLDPGS